MSRDCSERAYIVHFAGLCDYAMQDPGPDTVAAAAHNDSPQTSETGSSAAAGLSVAAAAGSRPPGLGPGPGPGGGRAALSRHADTWEPLLSALSTVLYGIMSMRLNTSSGKGECWVVGAPVFLGAGQWEGSWNVHMYLK